MFIKKVNYLYKFLIIFFLILPINISRAEFFKDISNIITINENRLSSGEVRGDYIHSHSIALHALGIAGNALIKNHPKRWQTKLKKLSSIDWARSNSSVWEGRTLVGGMIHKASNNVVLTSNYIKTNLGLDLTPEELKAEKAFLKGHNGN